MPFRALATPSPTPDDWQAKFSQQATTILGKVDQLKQSLQNLLDQSWEATNKEEYLLLERLRCFEEKSEFDQQKNKYNLMLAGHNAVFNLPTTHLTPQVFTGQPGQFLTQPNQFFNIQQSPGHHPPTTQPLVHTIPTTLPQQPQPFTINRPT
jgi:hypothetical protein